VGEAKNDSKVLDRAAAQLADIAAGDRQELAELLVAVRTLRGLRTRA
jgi:glutamate dehydrogenase